MKPVRTIFKSILFAAALAALTPTPLFACAACFGQSDSSLAQGMNWGIFTLLGVIVTVLATIAGFFVYLIRKETAAGGDSVPKAPAEIKV